VIAAVVIPTCNRRDLLEQSIRALAEQTHESFEVIVIDDCSTDDTNKMVEQRIAEFPNTPISATFRYAEILQHKIGRAHV